MKKNLLIILICSVLRTFAQEVPPSTDFASIETAHFYVIFDKNEEALGKLVAKKLELAYKTLDPYFSQKPSKTTVIINDKTDIANGFATRIPYPHIMIYPVLPTATESLAEYGDWIFELLVHEYTHILTFEGSRGFIKYLRPIFGSVIAPNALLPRWWKEGVAVQMETQLSNGGRLRSSYQDAILRAFVLEDTLKNFKIYEINELLPSWPEGQRPYMFGALIWSQIVREKGTSAIKILHDRQAGRVPFFINAPFEELLGSDYEKFFEDTLEHIEDLVLKQIDVVKQIPETTNIPLGINAQYSLSPAVSPDGKYLAIISISIDDERNVQILEKNKKNNFIFFESAQLEDTDVVDDIYRTTEDDENKQNRHDGPPGGSIQKVSWFPDSTRILYDKVDSISPTQAYSDLYIYDVKNKTTEKLTQGLRAREGSVSANGEEIVFVKIAPFATQLGLLDLKSKNSSILWSAPSQERISYPLFISENEILFSLRKTSGEENLWIFNKTTKTMKSFLPQYPQARFPIKSGSLVYFTSTKNGIRNIYVHNLATGKTSPSTHAYASFSSFAVDPTTKDLYATKMTHKGPQIHYVSSNDHEKTPESLPSVNSLLGERYPLPKKADSRSTEEIPEPTDYSPWGYLWPQYWIPFLATSSTDNRFIFQAQTGGYDPLKRHHYDLLINYDSATQKTSLEGNYLNRSYDWGWGASYNQFTTYFVNANNKVTYTAKSAIIMPNTWHMNPNSSLQISVKDLIAQTATTEYLRQGMGLLFLFKDFSQPLALVSPRKGKSFYVGVNQYFKGAEYIEQTQYLAGSNFYFSKWLPENHAFLAKFDLLYSPHKISPIVGTSTSSLLLQQDPFTPNYLMRGYFTGHFIGETLINPKFEYRFPMREINKGHATDPFYLRRLHGALIADGVLLEGRAYKTMESKFEAVSTNQSFWSLGLELRFDLNLAYQLPLTTIIGIYNPLGGSYAGSSSVSTSFQISSIF